MAEDAVRAQITQLLSSQGLVGKKLAVLQWMMQKQFQCRFANSLVSFVRRYMYV